MRIQHNSESIGSAGSAGKILKRLSIIGMNTAVYSEIEKMFFQEKRTCQEISKIMEMEMDEVDSIVCDIIAKETPSGAD